MSDWLPQKEQELVNLMTTWDELLADTQNRRRLHHLGIFQRDLHGHKCDLADRGKMLCFRSRRETTNNKKGPRTPYIRRLIREFK
jgi:hypothetical protein